MAELLLLGLLFHFIGDYIMQNDWMAQNKTKSFLPAFIHATIYSLPFLFVASLPFWTVIYSTHFFIDRYRLAQYWIRLVNWNWDWTVNNYGYSKETPPWLSTWLMIIVDNTWHIIINSTMIYLSYNI